jgi:poly(3-hydroxybutyrate) depolymerase
MRWRRRFVCAANQFAAAAAAAASVAAAAGAGAAANAVRVLDRSGRDTLQDSHD